MSRKGKRTKAADKTDDIDLEERKTKEAKVQPKSTKRKSAVLLAPSTSNSRLLREFFAQDCEKLAQALLGKLLVRINEDGTRLSGVVVETEAYLGVEDPCCNTYGNRKTEHNAPMYEKPGTAFVYMTYGMYHCFNVVSGGTGAGVLLRAVEPREGIDVMRSTREAIRVARLQRREAKQKPNRNPKQNSSATIEAASKEGAEGKTRELFKETDLCNGPSKLCESFGITRSIHNTMDVCTSETLFFESTADEKFDIFKTTRIGLRGPAASWLLRFYIQGSRYISKP